MAIRNNGMILRQKLKSIFEEISDERIIYIYAPAGYGKTVAVRQWLNGDSRATASISLDDYDNTPLHFSERFCATLRTCQPKNATLTEIISHPAFAGAPDEYTLRAVSVLSKRKRSILFIDDLHFIHDERVLRLLIALLKRLPESFQIILVSRNDLPSEFSDLWIKGQLVCITAEQLRFNEDEISMLAKKRGVPVTLEQAKAICRYTDGWAIGINALLISGKTPFDKNLNYLERFIRSNIWDKWDEKTREFMLKTAAVRELEPSLCSALTGVADSGKLLAHLTQSGAFITQSKDGIYHYHHLFHDFLRNMLSERGEEYIHALQKKEGQWHLAQRNFINAAECFISCNYPEGLGKAVDMLALTNRENFIIDRLLPILQTPLFLIAAQKRPNLFIYMVWASLAAGKAKDMETYADQFYAHFPEIVKNAPQRFNNIFLLYFIDYRKSLNDLLNTAVSLHFTQTSNNSPSSISMNMPLIHRCARDFSEIVGENIEQVIMIMKNLIGWVFGEEADLLVECMKAGLYYEQGHLEEAHKHALKASAEIKEHFVPELKFCAMAIHIYILDALGNHNAAEKTIESLSKIIENDRAYYLNRNFNAMITRRKLENGDIQTANDWLSNNGSSLYDNLSFFRIYEAFTTCLAYITIGDYNSAIILLQKILVLATSYKRPLDIIESQILLSIAYWKKKNSFQKEAILFLEKAVTNAYSFGYTQLFVNEGAEISGMMRRLQGRAEQPSLNITVPVSFIKMLCLKMPETKNSGLTSGQAKQPVDYTDKQKAVMKLICEGKSYREITGILGIKLPTLRSHIASIYKKLDVTVESDAVAKIKTTGILKDD